MTLLTVSLTGCGQLAAAFTPPVAPPTTEDLVGTWVHDKDDSSTGATLTIDENGTFTFDGVPYEVLCESATADMEEIAESDSLESGSGTWSIPEESPTPFPTVDLTFDETPCSDSSMLDVTYHEGLTVWIGDPDSAEWYGFTRDDD